MDLIVSTMLVLTRPATGTENIENTLTKQKSTEIVVIAEDAAAASAEEKAVAVATGKIARRQEATEVVAAAVDKAFTANVSAYTAAADECGKSDGITASGTKVAENRTLACPPQYAFGTKVAIDGMGVYVCEDRGGAIKGNRFDIYVPTKSEAFAFGRQHLSATVID